MVFEELDKALIPSAQNPTIPQELLEIFISKKDQGTKEQIKNIAESRFRRARQLYQAVLIGQPHHAVFYRIEDRDKFESAFEKARIQLSLEFIDALPSIQPPQGETKIKYFLKRMEFFAAQNNDRTKLQVAKFLSEVAEKHPQGSAPNTLKEAFAWFGSQSDAVKTLAQQQFYKEQDLTVAYSNGVIYGPGEDHNWAVNAVWALAVVRKRLPIILLSELTQQSADRSHPTASERLNPSAFSLEISVAIYSGYGLSINERGISLQPPTSFKDLPCLPSKDVEVDLFNACVEAQKLHTYLSTHHIQDLKVYVHNICTTAPPKSREALITGLDLLLKGKSAGLVVDALSFKELNALNNVLFSGPVVTWSSFDTLRSELADREARAILFLGHNWKSYMNSMNPKDKERFSTEFDMATQAVNRWNNRFSQQQMDCFKHLKQWENFLSNIRTSTQVAHDKQEKKPEIPKSKPA